MKQKFNYDNARIVVEVKDGDINKALKVFKRKCNLSGHIKDFVSRKEYTKPTRKRRLLKEAAILKQKRKSDSELSDRGYPNK